MNELFAAGLESDEEPETQAIEPEIVEGPPAPLPALSVQPAQAAIIKHETDVKLWQEKAKAITTITDDETNEMVAEIALGAKQVLKIIDDIEEYYKRPALDLSSAVRTFAKKFKDPLEQIIRTMGRLQGDYRLIQENKARQEQATRERKQRELQARLKAEAEAAAKKGEVYIPVELPAPVTEPPKTVIHTSKGTASQVKHWKYELIDEALVPREYLSPDDKKIRESVTGGIRKIAGIRIYEEYDPRYRV